MIRPPLLRALVALASLLVLLVASSGPARAQAKAPAPQAAAIAEKPDEEAADSPRASMRSFFDLAERGRYQEASIDLDLPRGSESVPSRATSPSSPSVQVIGSAGGPS